VADLSGHRSYGSAAAASISDGAEELMTAEGIELIHPDDRERAQVIMRELNSAPKAHDRMPCRKEDGLHLVEEPAVLRATGTANRRGC